MTRWRIRAVEGCAAAAAHPEPPCPEVPDACAQKWAHVTAFIALSWAAGITYEAGLLHARRQRPGRHFPLQAAGSWPRLAHRAQGATLLARGRRLVPGRRHRVRSGAGGCDRHKPAINCVVVAYVIHLALTF